LSLTAAKVLTTQGSQLGGLRIGMSAAVPVRGVKQHIIEMLAFHEVLIAFATREGAQGLAVMRNWLGLPLREDRGSFEGCDGRRFGVEVALSIVDAKDPERVMFCLGFDAFGDHRRVHA